MNNEGDTNSIILVVEDVNETRDGIERLLKADGYRVTLARDEKDAIESAQRVPPNLILVSVAGLPHEFVIAARHIRGLFFFNDTATTEIYTRSLVGSVRCVEETVALLINPEAHSKIRQGVTLEV